ncbi:hypothetical protein LJC08_03650 [Methanimicrococcus sp. OttesenSCG-928-J09]|nr:hypothetical protein [Methanimicrococcus sp. OttesenSCG-928-J09]
MKRNRESYPKQKKIEKFCDAFFDLSPVTVSAWSPVTVLQWEGVVY